MIKLGCATWSLTNRYSPPVGDALEKIAQLGFSGTELIVSTREDLEDHYGSADAAALRERLEDLNLEVSQFVVYKQMIEGLTSKDSHEVDEALELFETACVAARDVGAGIINTVSHWIPGLVSSNPYPPAFLHPSRSAPGAFSPKLSFTYPDFDWEELWSRYAERIARCCDIAASYGLRFSLEGHPHVIVSHTDSFLAFYDLVNRQNFGMNYDTSMQTDQREHVPIALHKLGKKLIHMHVRDSDSLVLHQLPIGQGVLDWAAIIQELQEIDYDGYLSLEFNGYAEPEPWIRSSLRYLQNLLNPEGV